MRRYSGTSWGRLRDTDCGTAGRPGRGGETPVIRDWPATAPRPVMTGLASGRYTGGRDETD